MNRQTLIARIEALERRAQVGRPLAVVPINSPTGSAGPVRYIDYRECIAALCPLEYLTDDAQGERYP